MTDMLQEGMAWLAAQRKAHMSKTVTYKRGDSSVQIAATPGSTVARLPDAYGMEIRVVMRDYLITAADLVLDGQTVEPEPGDQVEEIIGSKTYVHEVTSPGADEPCWRYSDPYHNTIRVHTKHVETVT